MATIVHAAPHSAASWYTHARLASYSSAEPPPTTNVASAATSRSGRRTGESGRSSRRTCQWRWAVPTMATSVARTIDSWVRRPSKRLVTATIGRRRSAGHGPWYMYARPSCRNFSMVSTWSGISQFPASHACACAS